MSGAPHRHERTKEVFLAAIELDVASRPEFLEEACGQDATLRLQVEELLLGHASSDDFLEWMDWDRKIFGLSPHDLFILQYGG